MILQSLTSFFILYSEQLNKIDEDVKRLLTDKLSILQSMQGRGGDRTTLRRRVAMAAEAKEGDNSTKTVGDPKDYVAIAIEQSE